MPTYNFLCLDCGEKFEQFLLPSDKDKDEIKCPKCGAPNIKKLPSHPTRLVIK